MAVTEGPKPFEMTSWEMNKEIRKLRALLADSKMIVEAMAGEDCESYCGFDCTECSEESSIECWPTRAREVLEKLRQRG